MADYKFRVNMNSISNNLVTYFIKEDILEKDDGKSLQPNFNNKIDGLQKRYIRLQKYLSNPAQIAFKSKNTLYQSYLTKFRLLLEEFILNPLLNNDNYRQPLQTIIDHLIDNNKKDAKFFEHFCNTQMFSSLLQKLKDLEVDSDLQKSILYL